MFLNNFFPVVCKYIFIMNEVVLYVHVPPWILPSMTLYPWVLTSALDFTTLQMCLVAVSEVEYEKFRCGGSLLWSNVAFSYQHRNTALIFRVTDRWDDTILVKIRLIASLVSWFNLRFYWYFYCWSSCPAGWYLTLSFLSKCTW